MRLLMVFNPNACAGRAAQILPALCSALENFAALDVLQTGSAGDAVRQVGAADLSSYDGLLAAGGDGTLFEVLNGLYTHEKTQRIPIGLLPIGTGNAFARDLGLVPGDWEKAVDLIAAGRAHPIDVGRIKTPAETCFFLNIVGAGLPVDALKTAGKLKLLGNPSYTMAALWHAMKLKNYPLALEIDGKNVRENSMLLEVSNSRYTGTSFLMAPGAVLDDGLLDITLLGKISRRRLLRIFPSLYKGRHVRYEEVHTRKAKEVRIMSPAGLVLAPDGELWGQTPATITCLHRDLQIFSAGFGPA